VMPAGRLLASDEDCEVDVAGFAALGLATANRFFVFVSTTTLFERPWLKLCFTLPPRGPRTPNVFLPSLSLI
jgi:hypothetical protein